MAVGKGHSKSELLRDVHRLRHHLRESHLHAETWRHEVEKKKKAVEEHQLKLQNLLYQKDHLLREIQDCRSYQCKELKKVNLEEALQICGDSASHDKNLMLLSAECERRKKYVQQLEETRAKKQALEGAEEENRKVLRSLPKKLEEIEKATDGLEKVVNPELLPHSEGEETKARTLPTCLYTLYHELRAYFAVEGKESSVRIEVEQHRRGDRNLRRTGYSSSRSVSPKRHHSSSRSRSKTKGKEKERESLRTDRNKTSHELKHILHNENENEIIHFNNQKDLEVEKRKRRDVMDDLPQPEAEYIVARIAPLAIDANGHYTEVAFRYIAKWNIVTAQALDDPSLLINLLEGDDGQGIPSMKAYYEHSHAKKHQLELNFSYRNGALPFQWAQWICGLRPSGTNVSAHPNYHTSIRSILDRIRERAYSRSLLNEILHEIKTVTRRSSNDLFVFRKKEGTEDVTLYIDEWEEERMENAGRLFLFEDERGPEKKQTVGSSFYRAKLRNEGGSFACLVEIPVGYPEDPSRFLFQLRSSEDAYPLNAMDARLKALESDINARFSTYMSGEIKGNLLKVQLHRIASFLLSSLQKQKDNRQTIIIK